jgi:hypothetical protein
MPDSAPDAGEHVSQSPDIKQAGRGISTRRLQENVVGLVLASTS